MNRIRERWAAGEAAVNAWLMLEGAASAALVATAGFDAVTLDLQHGAARPDDAGEIFAVIDRAGASPLVRVRANDPAEVMRMLDVGARGIVCPMVGSRREAERLVAACRYPPLGERSFGPVRGALGSGREHVDRSNEDVIVLAMIETAEGLASVEEIAATPGLDGVHVGPADLSLGLGLGTFADLTDPELLEALDRIVAAASANGVVAGIHAPAVERAREMLDRGFAFVTATVDTDLVSAGARSALDAVRAN